MARSSKRSSWIGAKAGRDQGGQAGLLDKLSFTHDCFSSPIEEAGLRYVLLVLAVVGLASCNQAHTASNTAPASSGGPLALDTPASTPATAQPVGRFQIFHSPHVERDTFMLDTATGKSWQLVRNGKSEDAPLTWEAVGPLP